MSLAFSLTDGHVRIQEGPVVFDLQLPAPVDCVFSTAFVLASSAEEGPAKARALEILRGGGAEALDLATAIVKGLCATLHRSHHE